MEESIMLKIEDMISSINRLTQSMNNLVVTQKDSLSKLSEENTELFNLLSKTYSARRSDPVQPAAPKQETPQTVDGFIKHQKEINQLNSTTSNPPTITDRWGKFDFKSFDFGRESLPFNKSHPSEPSTTSSAKPKSDFCAVFDNAGPLSGDKVAAPLGTGDFLKPGDDSTCGDDDFRPTYEPIVHLDPVTIRTGIEEDEVVFKANCKLYRFNTELNEFRQNGSGDIQILRKKDGSHHVILHRDQLLTIAINHWITPTSTLPIIKGKPNAVQWPATALDPDGTHKLAVFAARFKTEEDAAQFIMSFQDAMDYKQ